MPAARTHRFVFASLMGLSGCFGEIEPSQLEPVPETFAPSAAPGTPTDPVNPPPPIVGPQVMVGDTTIEPGRVVAHRLNRVEYNNTVRDLFYGLDLKPADAFPVDNFAEGFDNNAQELRMSNLLMEKYLEAADKTVASAFADAPTRGKLVGCDLAKDASCVDKVLAAFIERAYRRPVVASDLAPYLQLVNLARQQGDSVETGLQLAMRAALVSPSFLFRIEPDPPKGASRALGDFEIASRLSYFLWSTMPDAELFARGRAGALRSMDEVAKQTKRMLADPKASALTENLAGQWLQGRQLPELNPDPELFPASVFDAPLREAMRAEMTLFLREILFGDESAMSLLKADFTFANRRLATHYGLPNAASLGNELVRVKLDSNRRGGLLTQAGWLMVTSHPNATSPIKRGKWIMSELLCEVPPPPPPNVGDLGKVPQMGTLRERLAIHSQKEPCKTCHAIMDPYGFALENYDAIGRWRDTDGGEMIDASGAMPGTDLKFSGAAEMIGHLQKDPRFARCLARKLLTYATGRGLEDTDKAALDNITTRFANGGHRLRDLVEIITTSPLMTMRGGNSAP